MGAHPGADQDQEGRVEGTRSCFSLGGCSPSNRLVGEAVGGELLLSPQSVEIIKFGDPGRGR